MGFVKWMTSPGVFHDNHLHLLTASLSLFFSVSLVFWLPGKSIDFALSVCMCGCIWHINLTTLVIGEQVCAWNNWRHKSQLSPAPNNAVWWMQCLQPANYAAQLKWRTQTVVSGEVWASKEQKQERNRVYSSLLIELSAAKRVQKKNETKKTACCFHGSVTLEQKVKGITGIKTNTDGTTVSLSWYWGQRRMVLRWITSPDTACKGRKLR